MQTQTQHWYLIPFQKVEDYNLKIEMWSAVAGFGLAAAVFTALGPVGWIAGGIAAVVAGNRFLAEPSRKKVREEVFPNLTESF